jgi:hypothetical protein
MLFEEKTAQVSFEEIRKQGSQAWEELKVVARREDQNGKGEYPETERLLANLKKLNEDYLALALPRIEELLVPPEKRRTKTTADAS